MEIDTVNVELPIPSLNEAIKSIGISLDVTARKMTQVRNGSRRHSELVESYMALLEAQDVLRDAQQAVVLGGER